MEYWKFYDSLLSNRLITTIWKEVLNLLDEQIDDSQEKNNYLILLTILFSLVDDGNICMSLDRNKLLDKWNAKLQGTKILLEDLGKLNADDYNYALDKSRAVIDSSLSNLNKANLPSVIGHNRFFEIEDGWIYLRKTNVARKSLLKSIDRLFKGTFTNPEFDYLTIVDGFKLKDGQANVVKQGLTKNLVITGGPGTGKTTSILFLLLGLLQSKDYDRVYLLAPSGKAASRMKDSIKGGLSYLKDTYVLAHEEIVDRIANLTRSTIHSALGVDSTTGAFQHNETFQLATNSIYIIDEASMIDVCLFASLLSAIPDDARVFIMGDKCQLPSVEAGAVFGELIAKQSLLNGGNVCELGEAVRFEKGSPLYELAEAINNEDIELPTLSWRNEILEIQENKDKIKNPVYYFSNPIPDSDLSEKEIIQKAVINFGKTYFQDLQEKCTNVDPARPELFKDLFENDTNYIHAVILTESNHEYSMQSKEFNKYPKYFGANSFLFGLYHNVCKPETIFLWPTF